MSDNVLAASAAVQRSRMLCIGSLVLLIIVCVAWEWFLAPLRSGGSWLMIKALPLMLALPGVLKGRRYTYQYASMLILFYFAEGVMRLFDVDGVSRICAGVETLLSVVFFCFCLAFCRHTR